jgi:twitching motility protein PilT
MALNYEQELRDLFETVLHEGGSDLHISSGRVPHLRVSSELVSLEKKEAYSKEDTLAILRLLVPKDKVDRFFSLEEVDFSYEYDEKVRFRGNAYYQRGAVSIALRAIQNVRGIRELNLPEVLGEFAKRKQGFFLVVGPVGSGKSTTLAAMVDSINQERKERIITIEDPIEKRSTP